MNARVIDSWVEGLWPTVESLHNKNKAEAAATVIAARKHYLVTSMLTHILLNYRSKGTLPTEWVTQITRMMKDGNLSNSAMNTFCKLGISSASSSAKSNRVYTLTKWYEGQIRIIEAAVRDRPMIPILMGDNYAKVIWAT